MLASKCTCKKIIITKRFKWIEQYIYLLSTLVQVEFSDQSNSSDYFRCGVQVNVEMIYFLLSFLFLENYSLNGLNEYNIIFGFKDNIILILTKTRSRHLHQILTQKI